MIENETSEVEYSGNASSTTPYTINFPFLDTGHIVVVLTDSEGTESTLTEGTDYSVAGTYSTDAGRYTGGSITTTSAHASSSTVTIKRVTTVTQPTELAEAGPFPAETLETALDRVTMISQEVRRDAAPGTSNVEASGTGVVVQTTEGTFTTRTISPASASGLTITNGSGVAGNPEIDVDLSERATVTSLGESDLIAVRASGVESVITAANLRTDLANGGYDTREVAAALIVPDQSNGCTVATVNYSTASETLATFASSGTNIGYFRWKIPGNYNGGAIKMKLDQRDGSLSVISGNVAWQVRAAKATHQGSTLDISGSYTTYVEDGFVGVNYYVLSDAIAIGSGFSPGDTLLIEIKRDTTHGSDTRNATSQIAGIQFQYPITAVTTAWA